MKASLDKRLSKPNRTVQKQLTTKETLFIKAFAQKLEYADACRIAYPNNTDPHNYGWEVANKPHIKPKIDAIKQRINDSIDDTWITTRLKEIHDKSLFQKIVLKKKKITEHEVSEEEQEVDQTPLALNALKSLAQFKRSAEQSLGTVNVQVVLADNIISGEQRKVIEAKVTKKE